MKTKLLFIELIIFGLSSAFLSAQGTWGLQTNPTTASGTSMQFVSASEGWIDLNNNSLLHTTNGGANWSVVFPYVTDNVSGLDAPGSRINFVNASTGWVLKTNVTASTQQGAILYKTTNGGANWSRLVISSTIGDTAIQVQFVDANYGWILVYNMNTGTPTFLKTTNGGSSWTATNGGGIFYYVNATIGYAFSAGPNLLPPYTIYKTTDGGTSWTPQYTDNTTGELSAMQFTDINNGWIIGKSGKIFHTTNGGTTWTRITNSGYDINYKNSKLSFINNTTGWIASQNTSNGNHFTLSTSDGGATWSTQTLPFSYDVFSMDFWDANNGWAASDYGSIAKYSGNLGINDNYFGEKNIIIYPNPNNGLFYFDLKDPSTKLQIEIYNQLGQKVYQETNIDQKVTNEINFEPQSKGIYFIKIDDGNTTFKDKLLIN